MRYFDLHCDTPRVCLKKNIMPDDVALAVSVKKGGIFEGWRQCFAVFVPDDSTDPQGEYERILTGFKQKISGFKKPERIFTLENGAPIRSTEFADRLAADGIKAVALTWNGENDLAGGAYCDTGLKPFGREVIRQLNRRKIALDLSHLNRQSFFAAAEAADTVFASHTCCYKTHNHPRNLTDEQLKYVADRSGVIGVCFYPEFLGTKYAFEGVWRHINHLLNLGLEDHIAIGSDFDGADMSEQLDGIERIPGLYRYLSLRGIPLSILDKFFFNNADRFFKNF